MRRRGILVGAWAAATALATLVAWIAVREVTAQVSPSAALPLPTTVALLDGPATAEPSEQATEHGARDEPAPVATPSPPPRGNQPPDEETAAGGQEPEDDPPPAPAATTEAYQLVGGSVTVRYRGTSTQLVQAAPNSGFVVDINDNGPAKVDVRFRSDRHESRLVTRIRNGRPDPERDERPR